VFKNENIDLSEEIEIDQKKLRNSFLEGIPDDLRGPIWKLVSKVPIKRQMYPGEFFNKL
jgi:hypothetical protein